MLVVSSNRKPNCREAQVESLCLHACKQPHNALAFCHDRSRPINHSYLHKYLGYLHQTQPNSLPITCVMIRDESSGRTWRDQRLHHLPKVEMGNIPCTLLPNPSTKQPNLKKQMLVTVLLPGTGHPAHDEGHVEATREQHQPLTSAIGMRRLLEAIWKRIGSFPKNCATLLPSTPYPSHVGCRQGLHRCHTP